MSHPTISRPAYPSLASASCIETFLREIHGHVDDFETGDLLDRIYGFDRYVLRHVPLSDIDPNEFDVHLPRAALYARRLRAGERAPPIVFDAEERSIIDGLHRVNGAVRAGSASILAYVGLAINRCRKKAA